MRLLICILLVWGCHVFADALPVLGAQNSQIRLPMPGRDVTAGYMTLKNQTDKPVTITAVSSPAFARVELHQHRHHDGMMRMEKMDSIKIEAGSVLEFAPGGLHLMLFSPQIELEVDKLIRVDFHLASDQQVTLTFPIVAMPKR